MWPWILRIMLFIPKVSGLPAEAPKRVQTRKIKITSCTRASLSSSSLTQTILYPFWAWVKGTSYCTGGLTSFVPLQVQLTVASYINKVQRWGSPKIQYIQHDTYMIHNDDPENKSTKGKMVTSKATECVSCKLPRKHGSNHRLRKRESSSKASHQKRAYTF